MVEATIEELRKRDEDSGGEGERVDKPRSERPEGTPPRSRAVTTEVKIGHVTTEVNGRRRVTNQFHDAPAHHPTPFYETVYALVARAVQQGMRAAAEGSKLSQ